MLQRFRKVSPTLYRSSAPTPEDIIWLNDKLKIVRVISLDKLSFKKIELTCKLLNIEHIDLSIDMKKSSLIRFISNIDGLLDNKKKTLIHCRWGRDRTGLACAIYRCKQEGWTADEAIEEANTFGFCVGLDERVTALYLSIIRDAEKKNDVNSASDIVDASRGNYDDNIGSPSENLSWSFYSGPQSMEGIESTPSNDPIGDDNNPLGGFGPSIVGGGTVI